MYDKRERYNYKPQKRKRKFPPIKEGDTRMYDKHNNLQQARKIKTSETKKKILSDKRKKEIQECKTNKKDINLRNEKENSLG